MPIKNFIFDLYQTLIDMKTDSSGGAWQAVADIFCGMGIKATAPELEALHRACRKAATNELKHAPGEHPEVSEPDIFMHMAGTLGRAMTEAQATFAYAEFRRASTVKFGLFPGTIELIAALRARGAKLFILSNAQACVTRGEIARAGLDGLFDGIMLSSECGVRKPDMRIYGMLFDKYSLDKAESVMIGDGKKADGNAAVRFGIRSLLIAEGGAAARAADILALLD